MTLIYNRSEWLELGKVIGVSEADLDNARQDGYIGEKQGFDCWLANDVKAAPPTPMPQNKTREWLKDLIMIQEEWKEHEKMNKCSVCDSPRGHISLEAFIRQVEDAAEARVRKEIEEWAKEHSSGDEWGEECKHLFLDDLIAHLKATNPDKGV